MYPLEKNFLSGRCQLQQQPLPLYVHMNIQELTLFRHLAISLHFGKTSQACNITPSGLTRAIQRLESETGFQPFYRDNRSVSLTPEGEAFRKYADETLQRWEQLQTELAKDKKVRGEISLYCSVTAMVSFLPDILASFREQYPEVNVNIQTGDAALALTKLLDGDVDLTIAALPDRLPKAVETVNITRTPLIFIGSKRFPDSIHYDNHNINFGKTPLIMAERGLSRKRLDHWFKQNGISPNIYAQVAGNEAIIAMVSIGCGIGFIPKVVLEKSIFQDQVRVMTNGPDLGHFNIGICTKGKNRQRPVIQHFWEVAEGICSEGAVDPGLNAQ